VNIMRLLLGLLSYVLAAVAIVGGAGLLLFSTTGEAVTVAPAQQEARKVSPRIQEWLDRKAEAQVYAEREKAAALAEKERVEALRKKAAATAGYGAFAKAHDNAEKHVAGQDGTARSKEKTKREARGPSRQPRDAEASGTPRASSQQALQYFPDVHGRSY
jgi:hypothetical protein